MMKKAPVYRRVSYQMQGLSWWRQILTVRKEPPRLELLEDWFITLHGIEVVVPQGFITDGASIPKLLWPLISPFGPLLEGAIIHDFGYQHGYLLTKYNAMQVYSQLSMEMYQSLAFSFVSEIPVFVGKRRQFFDELLRFITVELNGATVQASIAVWALKPFGWLVWSNYRKSGPGAYNSNSLSLDGVPDALP